LPVVRGEAKKATEGGRLQIRAPGSLDLLRQLRRLGDARHGGAELLAGQQAAVERRADGLDELLELLGRGLEGAQPGGLQEVVVRTERIQPGVELGRGQQVERAAHGPELHERAVLPEGGGDRVALEALHASVKGQLGRGHDLGVEAADAPRHVEHPAARRALDQVMAAHAPRQHLRPRELDRHGKEASKGGQAPTARPDRGHCPDFWGLCPHNPGQSLPFIARRALRGEQGVSGERAIAFAG
jgi:hypothetical protein